ncbi:hypothetical protein BD779DRAFT_211155 [Infundibulicybe gibba]|nr:hypothetical protein BD779DRAFT_211155 [Infundibulicybe gibba]
MSAIGLAPSPGKTNSSGPRLRIKHKPSSYVPCTRYLPLPPLPHTPVWLPRLPFLSPGRLPHKPSGHKHPFPTVRSPPRGSDIVYASLATTTASVPIAPLPPPAAVNGHPTTTPVPPVPTLRRSSLRAPNGAQ